MARALLRPSRMTEATSQTSSRSLAAAGPTHPRRTFKNLLATKNPPQRLSSYQRVRETATTQGSRWGVPPLDQQPLLLARARGRMHAAAAALKTIRSEGHEHDDERRADRLMDLVCNELERDEPLPPAPGPIPSPHPWPSPPELRQPSAACSPKLARALRAASAIELVEHIELMLKARRPALALTLRHGMAGSVEVERTGPREVSLRIVGRNGPPPPEDVTQVREALSRRGLKLSSLSVA